MEINEYKKKRISQFKADNYINNFIKEHQLSDEQIFDNYIAFDLCYESLQKCKHCQGLALCPQAKKGERVELNYDNLLTNDISYCDLYLKKHSNDQFINSYIYSDIPKDLYSIRLENLKVSENESAVLLEKIVDIYQGKRKKGLFIYGMMGVGKTYLSIALANSLVAKNYKVAFIKTNSFVTKMSNYIQVDSDYYDNIVSKISKCDYVIFDDIGSEIVTQFSRDRLLMSILDYRMENKLCTIFTSNCDKNYLLKYYSNNSNSMNAKRLLERIDILSEDFCLEGTNKRRNDL